MFRQKQTPKSNNLPPPPPPHPPQKNGKCKVKTTGEHPWEWLRVIPTKLHMQLYGNHTPTLALPCKSAAHSQNTLSEEHLQQAAFILIFNLEVRFCQKKLIESKNSWDHWYLAIILWLWLLKTFLYIIWENFLIREKRISVYSL